MNRADVDVWLERGIQFLVVAILVFGPLATGAVRTLEFLVIQGLTVLVLLLWLARVWLKQNYRLWWPPVCWAVLAFTTYAIFRYRGSELEFVARRELIRVLVYTILFLVILNNFARQESFQLATAALLVVGMAVSIYAIYQFATNSERVWHFIKPAEYVKRGSGTYICPNHLAGFLEMILPLGLSYALIGRLKPVTRIFVGYASLVILAGIAVSVSRGGWIATGVSLLLLFFLLLRRWQYQVPALIFLALLIFGVSVFYRGSREVQRRIQPVLGSEVPDNSAVRFVLWESALRMWRGNIWLGVGPGHFDHRFPEYRPLGVQYRAGYTHNDYLNCLADWGVIGLALVAGTLVLSLVGVFRTWKHVRRDEGPFGSKPSNRAALVLGATTSLVAILVHSLLDFNMQVPANAILAISLLAMLGSCMRFGTERYWFRLGLPGQLIATIAMTSGVLYLGSQGWQKSREYDWFAKARSESSFERKLSALKRASSIDPNNFETIYAVGESLRQLSWQGEPGFEKLATEAMEWFQRGMRLNPYDAYNHLRTGMCLDWMGRHEEAAPFYTEALKMDPNNYYLQAHQGWHFVQVGDLNRAHLWFGRSWSANWWNNPIAASYLSIVEKQLRENQAKQP